MEKPKIVFILGLLMSAVFFSSTGWAAEPSMAEYTCDPIFQVNAVKPNILIILDNSTSMNEQVYTGAYDHNTEYYGYFEPYKTYTYGVPIGGVFCRSAAGWDGNFLNWLTMRRIDVVRKVIMGGLCTSRTGGGNQTLIGETPTVATPFTKNYDDTDGVTPFASGTSYSYVVESGNFVVDGSTYILKVQKDMNTYPDEADNFDSNGNLSGVLQKVGSKARWGHEFFNIGTGKGQSGGYFKNPIGTNMTNLVTGLQNTGCDTYTPLAEAYYVAMEYFKQQEPEAGLDYENNFIPETNAGDDPYYDGTEWVHCAKAFVILLTDGASTFDMKIPDAYKDYADAYDTFVGADDGVDCSGESFGATGCEYPWYGTDYLKDLALYARTTDLRSTTVGDNSVPGFPLSGDQTMILYTIHAFGNDANAENLLKEAAKNGGFFDKNNSDSPDLQSEWDEDNNGVPDTYYKANTGSELETKLLQAINDILERAASGTSVSVLATSGEGEGNLVQAYYRPTITSGATEVKWLGYLQCLWVDSYGYLREDTIQDRILNVNEDKVITYFVDSGTGDTMIKRFTVSEATPYPDVNCGGCYEELELDQIDPLWEAGSILHQRSADQRKIFTYLDKDEGDDVDEASDDPFDDSGEVVRFHTGSDAAITPYLGVDDNATWSYLGANLSDRVTNLIQYIRGNEIAGLRTRTINGSVWKLGDVVNSTPVTISKPPDNFHIIYGDESYQAYYDAFKDRETVVYVGANDGMLHAFTSWQYNSSTRQYTQPGGTTEAIGDELWAYVPQNLLPHLKWLPATNYSHVFYVDLKPKVFDAKILPDGTHYNDGDAQDDWGTILLVGFNLGGGDISVSSDFNYDNDTDDATDDRTFSPSYVCMDVTDPRNPTLLWERSYQGLEMTASIPAVVRVKDNWFAVFGSGPSDCDCDENTTTDYGHVFVVNLKTGEPYRSGANDWLFQTDEDNAFMNSPVSLDKNLNNSVDTIYIGETYFTSSWMGKMYKVTVPWKTAAGVYDGNDATTYSDNPLDATNPWTMSILFDSTRPITAPAALSVDEDDNAWIYAGTGRYLNTDDKTNADTQYLFGIKDPFYNSNSACYHSYSAACNPTTSDLLEISDLFDADDYYVLEGGTVYQSTTNIGDFDPDLLALAQAENGWIRTLTTSKERILTKPSVLGGIVFVPSFVPNSDVCGYGGTSNLWGVYYETGTAYYESVFSSGTTTVNIGGTDVTIVDDTTYLGEGKASSLGMHAGEEDGATGFVQQSTGTVLTEGLTPAYTIKSGLKSWKEK